MARCERPGCSQAAEVAFGFQADPYVIWLDLADADVGERRRAGLLCRRHADAMVVPIGWALDDRRQGVPRLFPGTHDVSEPATPVPAKPRRPTRRRSDRPPDEPAGPTLFAGDSGAESPPPDAPSGLSGDPAVRVGRPADEPADEPADATPWRPVFDTSSDLGGLLSARSPLLSRAFGRRAEDGGVVGA